MKINIKFKHEDDFPFLAQFYFVKGYLKGFGYLPLSEVYLGDKKTVHKFMENHNCEEVLDKSGKSFIYLFKDRLVISDHASKISSNSPCINFDDVELLKKLESLRNIL